MRHLAGFLLLAATAAAGPKESLPADCIVVNRFDFDALRKSEVWGRIRKPIHELLGDGMGFEGLFEGLGFDPETDLSCLTFALGGDVSKDEPQVYAIARGTFDAKKFADCLTKAGLAQTTHDGKTVFEDPEAGGKVTCAFHGAFALVDGTVFFADPASGIDALFAVRREGATPSAISKALEAAPEAHAWTVFLPTPEFRKELGKEPEGAPFAALKSAVVTYRVGPKIDVVGAAEAESEELAKQVLVVAQMGAMGLGLKERPELKNDGAKLSARLSIPLEEAMTMMGIPVESADKPGASEPVVTGGAPGIEGKGQLLRLALPGQVNKLAVSPDESHVFIDRAQESDVLLDAELRVVGRSSDTWGRMAFTLDGKTGLWPHRPGGAAEVRTIPELRKIHEVAPPDGHYEDPWVVCALPDGKTFVVVDWKSARHFHLDPPRWGEEGKPYFDHTIAGALDPKTGLLVLISNDTWLEVFDPANLKSVATVGLPREVTYDVAATGGRAWVGTKNGQVLPVDIEGRRVLDPVPAWDDGEVSLAMSGSGRTLIAVVRKRVDRDHWPTRLVAYEVASGELHETAAAEFVAPWAFNDVLVLEGSRTVILGGRESFAWRYGAE